MVAIKFNYEIRETACHHHNIHLIEKNYEASDLVEADIIIAAVNDLLLSRQISVDANNAGKLVNVADKPELCDFYLSSVVTKGNLKVAISTNGKSPTIAKRLKEVLNETLPAQLDDILLNMEKIRNNLRGDFTEKVITLNNITRSLTAKDAPITLRRNIQEKSLNVLLILISMIVGYIILSSSPVQNLWHQYVVANSNN